MWPFHRHIEFTARDFVVVDNAYTSSVRIRYSRLARLPTEMKYYESNSQAFGAMITYLIILIQFKMQEDELVASSSDEYANTTAAIYEWNVALIRM